MAGGVIKTSAIVYGVDFGAATPEVKCPHSGIKREIVNLVAYFEIDRAAEAGHFEVILSGLVKFGEIGNPGGLVDVLLGEWAGNFA